MATPIAKIKDWQNGMNSNIAAESGFQTMYCLDPHTRPGVLRVMAKMTADTINGTDLTGLMQWMEPYDQNGGTNELYGYDTNRRFYRRTGGTWTFLRQNGNTGGSMGLKHFNTSLYYTSFSRLGKLTGDPTVGANWTDSHKSLKETLDGTNNFNPLIVFAGSLYVGNGRYVGKLESDETTWDNAALTLPVGYRVQAVAEWGGELVLGTRSTNLVATELVAFWDGVSDFPDKIVQVPKPGVSALFNLNDTLFAFIGAKLYYYNGSEFRIYKQIPKTTDGVNFDSPSVFPGAVDLYNEQMLFGTNLRSNGAATSLQGVWSVGSHSIEYPQVLTFAFQTNSAQSNNLDVGAVRIFGTTNDAPTVYIAWQDGSTQGIDVISTTRRYATAAYLLTQALDIGGDFGKLVRGVKLHFWSTLPSNTSVTVKYRADENISAESDTSNFTTLGTIDSTNQLNILNGIYQRVKTIQFKLEFTCATATTSGPELQEIEIY